MARSCALIDHKNAKMKIIVGILSVMRYVLSRLCPAARRDGVTIPTLGGKARSIVSPLPIFFNKQMSLQILPDVHLFRGEFQPLEVERSVEANSCVVTIFLPGHSHRDTHTINSVNASEFRFNI